MINLFKRQSIPRGNSHFGTVIFINHGSTNNLEQLTEEGLVQVMATSELYFGNGEDPVSPNFNFTAVFHSEKQSAKRSVEVALEAIRHPAINVQHRSDFNVSQFLQPGTELDKFNELREEIGTTANMTQWLEEWSSANMVRKTLQDAIDNLAGNEIRQGRPPIYLVGHHGPFMGFVADNPDEIGPINTADLIVYTVSWGTKGRFIHGEHYKCPLHD